MLPDCLPALFILAIVVAQSATLVFLTPQFLAIPNINAINASSLNFPPDPYDFAVPGSSMTVEFYSFTGELPRLASLQAINQAFNDAAIINKASDVPIGRDELQYTFADVHLFVYPREEMTWRMLRDGTKGMTHFVAMTPFGKRFSFILLQQGIEGEVGWGAIMVEVTEKVNGPVAQS